MDERLQPFADLLAQLELLSEDERQDWAPVIVRQALSAASRICGATVLKSAYGASPAKEDRQACLKTVSDRLWTLSHFFAALEHPSSGSSVMETANEAFCIAGGDAPTMFAQLSGKQGRRLSSYKLALTQIAAFEWEAYLKARDQKASAAQSLIADAFGATWPTIYKWKAPVAALLGDETVRDALAVAERCAWNETRSGIALWWRNIEADGAAYKRALGFT